jgi:hypothetical protein
LITKEEVLTGKNGFAELELQHIDHLKQRGKISDKEYENLKRRIDEGDTID